METDNNWLYVPLIIISIWFWRDHHNLKQRLESLQDELSYCEDSLQISEDNLNQANSNIEDAQSYALSSYEEMGYALDNIERVD